MTKLELALRIHGILQNKLATMTGIHAGTISQIVSGKLQPSDDQANRIAAALALPKLTKDQLCVEIDLGPDTKAYKSIFTSRKLAPAIQAKLDQEIITLKKELAEYKAKEPARLKALAEKTAKKFYK